MDYKKVVQIINSGNLVILPTDTIYGIIGDALNKDAIEKVYVAKKREKNKQLILLVDSIDMAKKYTKNISELESHLYEKYSKYSLTIELQKNDNLPKEYNSTVTYVGVRIPYNDDLIKIIKMLNRPVFSTSANISGQPVITSVSLLNEDLKKYIDYIYDAGVIKMDASTIVKVENNRIIIIRDGKAGNMIKRDFNL